MASSWTKKDSITPYAHDVEHVGLNKLILLYPIQFPTT